MLDSRRGPLVLAVLCLAGFGALTALVVGEVSAVLDVDREVAEQVRGWARGEEWLRLPLLGVELAFGFYALTAYTFALTGGLLLKGHRRAGTLVLATMVAGWLAMRAAKLLVDRDRPEWQAMDHLHLGPAFPSGHASGTAGLAALAIMLSTMLIRRGSVRRLLGTGVVLVLLVVVADRLLLGRHYPLDVIAGVLLGVGVVLLGMALYSPLPRSHAAKADPLPEAIPTTSRNLAVVLNPSKVEDVEDFRGILTQMAAAAGWSEPRWHYTTVEDSGTGQAHQAAVEGADLVVVCGGDGTVREVCAELAGTGIPVGILPAGTGNLLARNLELPLYIRAAIDVALTGQDRAIDMVRVSGDGIDDSHFLVMAGLGFDAAIMEGVNEDIKAKVGWLAYVWSGLKALMFPTMKIEVTVDGEGPTVHRARTVVIGNVGSLQGGMTLLPDATIDDGQVDVVLLYPRRFLSWIPLVLRVLTRRERKAGESVARFAGREITVRANHDVPRQIDGDTIGQGRELTCENIHGRLLVRVPR
ncbi:phosphatase PAP2 family protein [Nocardioides panacisoli]|uniref:diacylglycerol kinase family protein n=1 Tax=Nocardioides panacisoli TaxID=627624 RepID=UPI001C62B7D0|nr:diacylglycerol kinase family protein [Nocardioides panacisoli]QYJ03491.1 phosphatase PAP2 family protein [Nocardioides panacisoli]